MHWITQFNIRNSITRAVNTDNPGMAADIWPKKIFGYTAALLCSTLKKDVCLN